MAAHPSPDNSMDEECPECDRVTTHNVSVQILTESLKDENAEFSREPYRVAECQVCGHEQTRRMNNA